MGRPNFLSKSLSIANVNGTLENVPAAPDYLNDTEAALWDYYQSIMAPGYLGPETHGQLANLCRIEALIDITAREIDRHVEARNAVPDKISEVLNITALPGEGEGFDVDAWVKTYAKLSDIQNKQIAMHNALARALCITNQSSQKRKKIAPEHRTLPALPHLQYVNQTTDEK